MLFRSLMTDIGVLAIAQHCPLLNIINLSYCRLITDIGVSAIAQHNSDHTCPSNILLFYSDVRIIYPQSRQTVT